MNLKRKWDRFLRILRTRLTRSLTRN